MTHPLPCTHTHTQTHTHEHTYTHTHIRTYTHTQTYTITPYVKISCIKGIESNMNKIGKNYTLIYTLKICNLVHHIHLHAHTHTYIHPYTHTIMLYLEKTAV